MPLTRAQLLMGNGGQGFVLPDQVQGVRMATPPDGVTIDPDGTIHFDSSSAVGVMKLGQPNAYNSYVWPLGPGSAGQQLETDGSGNLTWADADGIDWTAKGQLIVGTGAGTDTLLNAGPNNQVLKTDSGAASGLSWSPYYVDVVDTMQGAAVIPYGTTAQRPNAPLAGYLRMNSDFLNPDRLEVYDGDGATWRQLAYVEPLPAFPAFNVAVNQTFSGSIYCSDFIVGPGVTLETSALFVFATNNVDIQGTIQASNNGPAGTNTWICDLLDGETVIASAGAGLGASTMFNPGNVINIAVSPIGSGAASGFVANLAGNGTQSIRNGAGGAGGGSVIIRCLKDITVTGTIEADGQDAIPSTQPNNARISGSGGGSGGTIILDANRNITLNGALLAAEGGDGGAGFNNGGGGGGGGGGYIITQARFGTLNIIGGSSRVVGGGAPGASAAPSMLAGAGGASNAGRGGNGQRPAGGFPNPVGGSVGVVSNFGSIYSLPLS